MSALIGLGVPALGGVAGGLVAAFTGATLAVSLFAGAGAAFAISTLITTLIGHNMRKELDNAVADRKAGIRTELSDDHEGMENWAIPGFLLSLVATAATGIVAGLELTQA